MNPCWTTIAETIYEIRSNGQLRIDAADILSQELLGFKAIDPELAASIKDFRASVESPNDDFLLAVERLFGNLKNLDEFSAALGKIAAQRLRGMR